MTECVSQKSTETRGSAIADGPHVIGTLCCRLLAVGQMHVIKYLNLQSINHNLTTRVSNNYRLLNMTRFDRLYMTSY